MSDNDPDTPKTQPLKTQPLKKTSAVPLRKETVRVTLKATPGGVKSGAPAPTPSPAPPSAAPSPAPVPTPRAAAPAPAPSASAPAPTSKPTTAPLEPSEKTTRIPLSNVNVDLPDVTSAVPLKAETMRVTLKAESAPPSTVPLGAPPSSPRPATAAPTIPLGGSTGAPATVPLATQPLNQPGSSSQPLPQATVQLQQTQQLTQLLGGGQAATIQTIQDDETRGEEKFAGILAVAAFFAALIVLGVQFSHLSAWVEEKGLDLMGELF